MTKFLQEVFWTPGETIDWVHRVVGAFDLWAVLWLVGNEARLVDANELRPEIFYDRTEDTAHLFLGSSNKLRSPQWRDVSGKRLLDFQRSYAVQFVPSVISPDRKALLQGRLAILPPDQYDDPARAAALVSLYRSLQLSMKKQSDQSRVVTQVLQSGEPKTWKQVLVGKAIPRGQELKLKQFADGVVEFQLVNV
jgi:hypothetical protein